MFLLQNSQLGGFIDGIINGLMGAIGGFLDFVLGWLIDTVWALIASFLYTSIIYPMLSIIDCVAILFRKFAGLGTFTSHGVQYTNTDFLYSLITNDTVMNIFWAMLILGVILLFITTFVAVIKSETTPLYDKNGGNNKVKVLKQTGRTILNFAIVPVCAVIGIMLGNVLLRTLDQATGGSNSVTGGMSGRVFVSAAYNANRVRRAISLYEDNVMWKEGYEDWLIAEALAQSEYKTDLVTLIEDGRAYELAQAIDDRYIGSKSNNPVISNDSVLGSNLMANPYTGATIIAAMDVVQIVQYYNIGQFNFILAIIEAVAVLIMLINITLGLIKRLFAVVTLFVCAPPIVAVSPLQPTVLKEWNKAFISQVIAGYSSVVGMNMFLIILGALSDIQFFSTAEVGSRSVAGFMNSVIMILIVLAGLFFVKDVIDMVSKIIGGDNALKAGQDVAGKMAKVVGSAVGMATGGVSFAMAASRKSSGMPDAIKNIDAAKSELAKARASGNLGAIDAAKERLEKAEKDKKDLEEDFKKAGTHFKNSSKGFVDNISENKALDSLSSGVYGGFGKDMGRLSKSIKKGKEKEQAKKARKILNKINTSDPDFKQEKEDIGYMLNGDNKYASEALGYAKNLKKQVKMREKQDRIAEKRQNEINREQFNAKESAQVIKDELERREKLEKQANKEMKKALREAQRYRTTPTELSDYYIAEHTRDGNEHYYAGTKKASQSMANSFWNSESDNGGEAGKDGYSGLSKINEGKLNQIEASLQKVKSENESVEKDVRKLQEQNKKLEETLNNLNSKSKK